MFSSSTSDITNTKNRDTEIEENEEYQKVGTIIEGETHTQSEKENEIYKKIKKINSELYIIEIDLEKIRDFEIRKKIKKYLEK